jgi:hypothetical protein
MVNPVDAFQETKLSFSVDSIQSSHDTEIKAVEAGTRTETFAKDSSSYFWESKPFDIEKKSLFKTN